MMLSTARAGRAKYLITNGRDLLDLPGQVQQLLPFRIVTPREYLDIFEHRG
jgi:predicted nucleic acid-binding protein